MIDVDDDPDAAAKPVADVVGVRQAGDDSTVAGEHRMQRLQRKRHSCWPRMVEKGARQLFHLGAGIVEVAASGRQSTREDEDMVGAEFGRLVDRAACRIEPARAVAAGQERPCPVEAESGDAVVVHQRKGTGRADPVDLVAPDGGARKAPRRASRNEVGHAPPLTDGRMVDDDFRRSIRMICHSPGISQNL